MTENSQDKMTSPGLPDGEAWSGEFQVQSYEVDFRGWATLETVCRHFQEAAWSHAEALGVRRVAGSSAWLVLSADHRRPQRLDRLLCSIRRLSEKRALDRDPEKLPDSQLETAAASFPVRYSDLDVNRHVNASRYVRWILDSYPMEFHQAHCACELEINYRSECVGGDTIAVRSGETAPGEYCHVLVKGDGSEPVCRARLRWICSAARNKGSISNMISIS